MRNASTNKRDVFFAKIGYVISMVIFGAISIARNNINLSTPLLCAFRGVFGGLFLFLAVLITRSKTEKENLKRNLPLIILSGVAISMDWMLFFNAYEYTSVATATVCYYMAPIIFIAVSPLIFGEKLTFQKITCVIVALIGLILVSGILEESSEKHSNLIGVGLGLSAAVVYAILNILNKKISGVNPFWKTAIEISVVGVIMIPYVLLFDDPSAVLSLNKTSVIWLVIICLVSTGLAYFLYLGNMEKMQAQTVAVLSYLDPFIAVIVSVFVLKEGTTLLKIIGCVLILSATLVSEIDFSKRKQKTKAE